MAGWRYSCAVLSYRIRTGRWKTVCKMPGWLPTNSQRFWYFALLYLLGIPENQGTLGSILNWLKQFRRPLKPVSGVKKMNLQAGLSRKLDDEAGLVLFACFLLLLSCPGRLFHSQGDSNEGWQHLGIQSIKCIDGDKCTSYAEENEFSSQNPIQRSTPISFIMVG